MADEVELVSAIAAQMTLLIDRMEAKERTFSRLSILHRISDIIQFIDDLDEVLRVILTGVTAGYGLGFNRAVLLRLDDGRVLRGSVGIGEVKEAKARAAWVEDVTTGPGDLERFLQWRESGQAALTTVGELARGLVVPLAGAFAEVVDRAYPRVVPSRSCRRCRASSWRRSR